MRRVFRFIRALYRYTVYGHMRKAGFTEFADRIGKCAACREHTSKYTCGVCGCRLDKKCSWSTEHCPCGKW